MTQSDNVPVIPGYKHLTYFDKGGMGRIYRGLDEKTGVEVIIKCMNVPDDVRDSSNYQRRFARETDIAKIMERVHRHRNVLAAIGHGDLFETGSEDTIPYLVYPYLEHGSLSKLLKQEEPWHTWPLPQIADLLVQAAEGLFHLHKIGVVHQDVKPNNFLWSPGDMTKNPLERVHIWLIDFGTTEWEGKATVIYGTRGYMAPEQSLGEVRSSSDQYALAVMARLFLTGYQPPREDSQDSLLSIPLTQLNPALLHIPDIDHIVLKALSQGPEDRFASVLEFARALQTAILEQETKANRKGLSSRKLPTEAADFYQKSTEQSSEIHPLRSQQTVQPSFPSKDIPLVTPPIQPIVPYVPLEDIPSPLVQPPKPISGSISPSFPTFPLQKLFSVSLSGESTILTWSPDGRMLLCTFLDTAPRIVHSDQHVEQLSDFTFGHNACWSPDSRLLAISMYNSASPRPEVRIWNLYAPKESYHALRFPQGIPIYGLDWSSIGLLALWLENSVFIYDLSQLSTQTFPPSPLHVLSLHTMRCDKRTALRWSPDGAWLAAGANNGTVVCWNVYTRISRQQLFKRGVESISWSPDSTTVVVALANKMISFWNPQMDTSHHVTLAEQPRMVSISAQTAQLAIATDKMLFFGDTYHSLLHASHPGRRLVAWSATNKIATIEQQEEDLLVVWQA